MSRAYTPPSWSTAPKFDFFLEILKNGAVVERVPLNKKDHYIIGRQADACDIVLAHDSVSRQHAALQFGEAGELYISDLGSTHGTKLNKTVLKPKVYTILPVGSVLQFGESTRLFVIDGPAEFIPPETSESTDHAKLREQSEQRQLRKAMEKGRDTDLLPAAVAGSSVPAAGSSWGMQDDVLDDAEDDEIIGETEDGVSVGERMLKRLTWVDDLDLTLLNDKDRIVYDRLKAKQTRVKNLLHEVSRIMTRHSGKNPLARQLDEDVSSLTSQQSQQLSKHEENIQKVLPQLEEDAEQLRNRLELRGVLAPTKRLGSILRESAFLPDVDNDDVEDVTEVHAGRQSQVSTAIKTSTGVKLIVKNVVKAPAAHNNATKTHADKSASSLPQRTTETFESLTVKIATTAAGIDLKKRELEKLPAEATGGADDELEKYMASTQQSVLVQKKKFLEQEIQRLESEKLELEQLLDIAKPAFMPLARQPIASSSSFPGPTSNSISDAANAASSSGVAASTITSSVTTEPAQKPISKPELSSTPGDSNLMETVDAAVSAQGLAGIKRALDKSINGEKGDAKRARIAPPAEPPLVESAPDIWGPPSGQTGDGRTSLNDKYGY